MKIKGILVLVAFASLILEWLFLGKEGPQCEDRADVNDDGMVDVSDPVRILTMPYSGAGPLQSHILMQGLIQMLMV